MSAAPSDLPITSPEGLATSVRVRLRPGRCRTTVLSWRPGRSVVVRLDTDAGAFVAKATSASAASRAAVASAVLSAAGDVLVPRLVLFEPQLGLVVHRHLTGPTLQERAGDLSAWERCGTAVASVHGSLATPGPVRTPAQHLTDLFPAGPDRLVAAAPALAGPVGTVLAALPDPPADPRPLHRDLHPRQVVLTAAGPALVDWDLAAQGDPALDVGNLLAHLGHRRPQIARAAGRAFLDGYGSAPPHLPAYVAFAFLRLACKRFRLAGPAGLREATALVGSATRTLDGARAHR